jgi:hypothetical protein
MHDIQHAMDTEGYTLGKCSHEQAIAIDAKDGTTLSKIAEHPLITILAKFSTTMREHRTSSSWHVKLDRC